MTGSVAILVTGLPASGKTTLAHIVGQHLNWPVLDKDVFLETLYAQNVVASMALRRTLSQQADIAFQRAALNLRQAVLVSHWRPRHGPANTGTPTDWVPDHFDWVIEVHCACPLETCITRFRTRTRHPGHLDATRTEADVRLKMQSLTKGYPLGRDAFLARLTKALA